MPTRNDAVSWWRRSPTNGSLWSTNGMVRFRYFDESDINSDCDADFECDDSDALDLFFEELEVAR